MPLTRDVSPEHLVAPFRVPVGQAAGRTGELQFTETLRWLPGKRLVGAGRWHDEPVLIKLFYGDGARKNWRREDRGYATLARAGISAPSVLHSGPVDGTAAFVLVASWLADAQTPRSALQNATSDGERLAIFSDLVDHVAANHNAAVVQNDMHLGNFLLADGKVYSIDGARVRMHGRLSRHTRSQNLAAFFALLPLRMLSAVPQLFQRYAQATGFFTNREAIAAIERHTARLRRESTRRHLKKMFRNCTDIKVDRNGDLRRIYVRKLDGADPGCELNLSAIEQPPDGARMLKQGNTCTIWTRELLGRVLAVKRYNIKNALHGLKLALRQSRALKSWRNAHRLLFHGIATPAPIAAIVEKRGPFTRRAWFLAEWVDAQNAAEFFAFDRAMNADEALVARRLCDLVQLLSMNGIVHGDMKATNFLICRDDVLLLDLDAMREPRFGWLARRGCARDRRRFLANWRDRPELLRQFETLLNGGSAEAAGPGNNKG